MHTWAIISQKGGQGKTTLATGFAVEVARDGAAVVILDTDDRQGTASYWENARATDDVTVVNTGIAVLPRNLAKAEKGQADLVIIDASQFPRHRHGGGPRGRLRVDPRRCSRLRHRLGPADGQADQAGGGTLRRRPFPGRTPAVDSAMRWRRAGSADVLDRFGVTGSTLCGREPPRIRTRDHVKGTDAV